MVKLALSRKDNLFLYLEIAEYWLIFYAAVYKKNSKYTEKQTHYENWNTLATGLIRKISVFRYERSDN
jgi:hypothetical protein